MKNKCDSHFAYLDLQCKPQSSSINFFGGSSSANNMLNSTRCIRRNEIKNSGKLIDFSGRNVDGDFQIGGGNVGTRVKIDGGNVDGSFQIGGGSVGTRVEIDGENVDGDFQIGGGNVGTRVEIDG